MTEEHERRDSAAPLEQRPIACGLPGFVTRSGSQPDSRPRAAGMWRGGSVARHEIMPVEADQQQET
jgi:hypothetical protein